jgi:hypothetical protein
VTSRRPGAGEQAAAAPRCRLLSPGERAGRAGRPALYQPAKTATRRPGSTWGRRNALGAVRAASHARPPAASRDPCAGLVSIARPSPAAAAAAAPAAAATMPPRRSTKSKKAAAAAVPATPATAAKSKGGKNVVAATPLALDVGSKKGGDQAADAAVASQKPVNFFGKSMPKPGPPKGNFPDDYVFANDAAMREPPHERCVTARSRPPPPDPRGWCTRLDAVPAAPAPHPPTPLRLPSPRSEGQDRQEGRRQEGGQGPGRAAAAAAAAAAGDERRARRAARRRGARRRRRRRP